MSGSQNWYVQTTLGVLLGPMPADVLEEMQRTGALAPQDLVRRGGDGDWMQATQLPRFHEASRVDATNRRSIIPVEDERTIENGRARLPSSPSDTETLGPFTAASQPETSQPLRARPKVTHRLTDQGKGEVEREYVARTEDDVSRAGSAPAEPILKLDLNSPRGSAGVSPSWNPASRKASQNVSVLAALFTKHRTRRAIITSLLVLVFVTGRWLWPRADRSFYNRLQAIRSELLERRNKSTSQEAHDLKSFVKKAIAELDAQFPALEMKAKTGHQESIYLLRASRDCLKPMLSSASETQKPLEENLDYFLWALKNYYDGYQPLEVLPHK